MITNFSKTKNNISISFENEILNQLKSNQYKIGTKLAISVLGIFDKKDLSKIDSFKNLKIAQTIVKDQFDINRELKSLNNQVDDYLRYSEDGKDLFTIKLQFTELG